MSINYKSPLEIMKKASDRGYIGEGISQLEHALQAAYFAEKAGADADLVWGAFFHDIGHLCVLEESWRRAHPDIAIREMDDLGIVDHERIGADFLRECGFPERAAAVVEGHVQAKRYLVATHSRYASQLSPASRGTLEHQGGPMTAEEVRAFESDPYFKEKLQVRTWDERAKDPSLHLSIEEYEAKLTRYATTAPNT